MRNIKKNKFALLLFIGIFLSSCKDGDTITPNNENLHSTEIKVSEYVDNYYFLDPIYHQRYDSLLQSGQYFQNEKTIQSNYYTIKKVEVWKTVASQLDISKDIFANAYIVLDNLKPDSLYPEILRNTLKVPIAGESVINNKYNIIDTTEYEIYPNLGVIRFNFELENHLSIAVAYSIEGETLEDSDDIIFGEFINVFHLLSNSVKILKLIKPRNLSPSMTKAWPLKLRNIYNFNKELVDITDYKFSVKILLGGEEYHPNSGKSFLNLFNFDNIDSQGNLQPDGIFDYLPNKTINLYFNEIIFPALEPFGKNLPFTIDQKYQCGELYLNTKSTFISTGKDSIFTILVDYNIIE